ncbi:DEAD/DEAH box helicase [Paenibacillus baekrokdamisoli]|uniref:DNA 3'-5' helicase n=1 Tax=Paenibacillus baekrokdamisoli TaxID=1712516 RepID=A0A3G9IL25_9BACL|nr:DNA repair helicase XPB [Paenibacillus baekrokdamisoli]MBB3067181.1 DNA excision repair protein ERCC-3 [Paenibacillus baekrokdamisoli]BBH19627.1 DEAD/DEAH box helicase [Paenibacillus baekrokdamisoli]
MLKHEKRPLRVQADRTVLLDARHPDAEQAREVLMRFAELLKRPGDLHTYRMSSMSLWHAASMGLKASDIIDSLHAFSCNELPLQVIHTIQRLTDRYGKLTLERSGDDELLLNGEEGLLRELTEHLEISSLLLGDCTEGYRRVKGECRGFLKQELIKLGYPVVDLAGYRHGEALAVSLLGQARSGREFALRDYQERAVDLFYREGREDGGSGVLVLPCGAGKTVVGLAAIARLKCDTLILTSNVTSVKQWKAELLDKTTLAEDEIGEYAASFKQVCPITIATYQLLTNRRQKVDEYANMKLFQQRNWGLIIYDEVHLLPAPVFRMTADLQATRRLGLTATLIREDGREEDVFSLIGPKRFDLPWKVLEARNWIASVSCAEIRIPLPQEELQYYEAAEEKDKARISGENPAKILAVKQLLHKHKGKSILIIGQYLKQLHELAAALHAPLLTGELPHTQRESLYQSFKAGEIPVLVVSKVANFAVDLPDAAVAIQISGSFGSRQEEAQRIGRIMRPKAGDNQAWFYTVVTKGTKEIKFAQKRQLFLLEQGYRYDIVEWPLDWNSSLNIPTVEDEAVTRMNWESAQ